MAKKEIGRPQTAHIPPFGLRLQPHLKERIEAASKAAGRSMNAEIVDRLEASFANTGALAGLHEKLVASDKVAARHEMNAIKDRLRSLQYLSTLSTIIERLPAEFFDNDPKLAELVSEFRGNGIEILEAGMSQAIADLTRLRESISEGVASGRIQVVSQDEANSIRAKKAKP